MVDAVGQLALSVLTTLERVFALWKGLLDENILCWQCNYLEMMYVYIQPLWFFANKASLKQGITCMHYLQLAKLWLAGITQSQQRTSLHSSLTFCAFPILSQSFLFCSVSSCPSFNCPSVVIIVFIYSSLFLYAPNQLSIFANSQWAQTEATQNQALLQLCPHNEKCVNLGCRPC